MTIRFLGSAQGVQPPYIETYIRKPLRCTGPDCPLCKMGGWTPPTRWEMFRTRWGYRLRRLLGKKEP